MNSSTVGGKEKKTTSSYGMKTIIGSMMMLLLMVVFVGYTMIWIMMPTNTYYLHWLPDIYVKTDSTYFGQQGAGILIYTFPILFTATLGCLLLHIRNRTADNNNQSGVFKSSWKRPVLVKGPLGIVSWIELSFLAMFIALLVWSISSYLHGMFATITLQAAAKREHVWEAKLESTALMLGLVGNICLAFLFFPVARGSSILQLIGLTSEASIKYHIWLGHLVMTIFTAHGLCYIIFWASTSQISQMLKWEKIGIANVAGEVALLAGLAMWATSFPRIRRKIFELFFYSHHLYIVFIVFFVFHVGFSYACIMLPGFYLFMIDRLLRFLQSQQKIGLVSARVLPCEVVELSFSKIPGLSYSPTSMMFLNVPGISKLQWHPFTITSSSTMDPDNLSVVIKSEGSWSHNLYEKFSSTTWPMDRLEVSVEGPYGPASNKLLRHDTLVMVSGGSGITPLISIIRELLSQANDSEKKTPQVLLITAFKKSLDLTMLDLILPASGTNLDISCLQLQIEAYVTRENQPVTHNHKPLQTIWFNPDPLDSPVSAVLGRNSWLWLGVIIATSFVIFLVLMGILTRYYIYPIDHNSNMIYSASYRSALNMLLLCVSIATTATAVFLWNKKQNSKEMGHIQAIDTPPQITTSPSARFYNAGQELESLPHQSFVQSTKVHYGTRPDLQRILWGWEGSSVGVLVSGPSKMRQEVAAICSLPLAHNLHYHSMSFSW
ncbi:putative ferric-chelate reductase (NADH) [Rosa chinensis]|uniref:ferric-chelate reductase (NADH) n=1 Tax=Rosa chinensis TaxID=74649 RepID=A0A2P6SN69_ROSCH|nr:ferric reduction oxidase 2 [Rosa chinensis]PRQ60154.1 putative ferric-chelate reductase (NADH) [Rosa chinensis]